MFTDPRTARPLDPCCRRSRHDRIPRLLGAGTYDATNKAPLLYHQVEIYAPTRLYELQQTLFGVFRTECPFWGVYDTFPCDNPSCRRELHAILMDDILIETIDQMARQLYDLLDPTKPDDLLFRAATEAEKDRARRMLSNLAFVTGAEPQILTVPPPGQYPHYWVAEAMCNAMAFLVVHETTHQGPQTMGPDAYQMHIPGAIAASRRHNIQLTPEQAVSWAKELGADVNAYLIMSTDRQQAKLAEPVREGTYRCVTAGAALALKAWDLLIYERCYGNLEYHAMIVGGHPPARARIDHMLRYATAAGRLDIGGDEQWAGRIVDALDDLHL
jgi:hypothetical protein